MSTAIDLTPFFEVEERMFENDEKQNDLLFNRLDHLINQEPEAPEECKRELMSLDEIKSHVNNEYSRHAPFIDIPNIQNKEIAYYSDDELQFWSALIADYRQMISRVPKYSNIMIWSGVPPALRGLVWRSMTESYSTCFESLYDSLAQEWTPFVKLIGRDLNRTFPEIGLFQDKNGEGQTQLGRVLRAYSAYDMQVGYCQGLTFLAGPLLLHMSDRDAFCVLIKLMEDANVRSMFTPDMTGLQLRIYQFEKLFEDYLPELKRHFDELNVNPIYATQWFLSFFAVTCPLSMLVRVYDLIFSEGAIETLMRVALAVLKRNENILLNFEHDEEILQHLLGRSLWDKYGFNGDTLLGDVTAVNNTILDKMKLYEAEYYSAPKPIRALSRRGPAAEKNKEEATVTASSTTSRFPSFGWPAWASGSSSNNGSASNSAPSSTSDLTRSDSVHSFESTTSTTNRSSVATSVTSYDADDKNRKIQELEALLHQERREREQDKLSVESLMNSLDDNESFNVSLSQVKTRFGISDESGQLLNDSPCKSCEGYLMDLAASRSNEAMAKQELDELSDKYQQLLSVNTTTTTTTNNNPHYQQHVAKKSSWSLW